ncbi:hypothetical protein C8R43DRAFT_906282 [Mycena crocata]|nr:hypothetical protein C8R43DRAFT_906282 [Mycena crocata]
MWAENLLFDVKSYFGKHRLWQDAVNWLDEITSHTPHPRDLVNACRDMLDIIPWDGAVPGLSRSVHLTSQDLARFLGTHWLNDEMINAGVDWILRCLEPGSRIRILNCLFIQALGNARANSETYTPSTYFAIEKAILSQEADIVWFPLHVAGNHWTLLRIDLVAHTIAYADSLYGLPPSEELALIQWWLQSLLGGSEFAVVKPDFPCLRQQDGHSCGIIVLCILASLLLHYPIWISEASQCRRMEWFLRLSESFADGNDDGNDDNDDNWVCPFSAHMLMLT